MDIKYFKEEKITKKTNPKEPVKATKEGLEDINGEVVTYQDFFKSFYGKFVNVVTTESSKEDLEDNSTETEE